MREEHKEPIPQEWWDQYLKKYERLMYKIAHMISGDPTICTIEDNFNDLCVAAIESVEGYRKMTKKKLDVLLTDKGFDQYTKTCLWRRKARKGLDVEKKRAIRKCVSLTTGDDDSGYEVSSIVDKGYNLEGTEIHSIFDAVEQNKDLLDVVVNNPSVIKNNGAFNYSELGRLLDVSSTTATSRMNKLVYELEALGLEK
jgi:hypothetical protein